MGALAVDVVVVVCRCRCCCCCRGCRRGRSGCHVGWPADGTLAVRRRALRLHRGCCCLCCCCCWCCCCRCCCCRCWRCCRCWCCCCCSCIGGGGAKLGHFHIQFRIRQRLPGT